MHHAHGSDSHLHRRQRAVVSDAFSLVTSAAVQSTTTAAPVATETTPAAVTTTEVPVASSTTPAAVESTTTPAALETTTTTVAPTTASTTTTTLAEITTTSTTTTSTTTTEEPTTTTTTSTSSSSTTTSAAPTSTSSSSSSSSSTLSTTSRMATSVSSSSSEATEETTAPLSTRTTVIVVNGKTSTSTGLASGTALANSNNSDSSGPSTGAVVGIVAGALLGVVVIAAIIGYLLKKKRSRDDDEPSPFDRDEFRRTSAMLDDDVDVYAVGGSFGGSHHGHGDVYSGGHSPQMSEYSMRELNRSNTTGSAGILPGLARGGTLQNPRPPTAIMNHYNHQQMMPSFQPGQVIPSAVGGAAPYNAFNATPSSDNGMALYGGYPVPQHQQAPLDRVGGLYAPQHAPQQAHVNEWPSQGYPAGPNGGWMPQQRSTSPMQSQQGHLERGPSNASAYSSREDGFGHGSAGMAPLPQAATRGSPNTSREGSSEGHGRPLSAVREDYDDEHHEADLSSRSGTPTNANVQQTFFSHGREDSLDAGRAGSINTQLPRYEMMDQRERERAENEWSGATGERQRRLSIRNGGLDADDAYGGI